MSVQHLLLSSDGGHLIIEADELEKELVIPPHLRTVTGGEANGDTGHRVAVTRHYCKGRYYAVALDRHAASNEIDDVIDLLHPAPIDEPAS
ncbi:hypothetical protein HA41_05720 [Pantoea conspicua]|uniref:Uncharacterized protein n=1 Tax=Pantoea conspicua TaxID=472705 RepID=A0A1X1BZ01_9GAMM|nr:hypothetical protein [Pantoea conspicua]ORM54275.1 hypothetical protein HA41_05720 [Pantoea conspicua]